LNQSQLPSYLQQYQPRDIGATLAANLGSSMPPHVSISSNRFTLVDAANNEIPVPTFDPKLGPYLDAAIIDVNDVMSRIYFSGQYDSSAEGVRPDCFSDNGIGPSVSASSPQAPTCAACPRSEWTKINANGNKVPWCTQKQKVALLIPGFDVLFLLAVPPNSHGPMREYVNACKGNGVNIANLITRMWFVSQGTLGFTPRPGGPAMAYIDQATAELRERAYAEKRTDALVGRTDTPRPAGQITAGNFNVSNVNGPGSAGTYIAAVALPPQQPVQQTQQWPMQGQPQPPVQQGQWPQQMQQPAPQQGQSPQQPAHNHADQQMPVQWPQGQGGQASVPFAPPTTSPVTNAGGQGWPGQNAAPTAAPSSEQPATGRRKRRTQAEIAAANGQQPPAGAPQAPFPHPGQQVQQSGPFAQTAPVGAPTGTGAEFATGPGTAPTQLEFGIGQGQPAGADANVQQALDSFFGPQK
jgi:hypothetical protein